MGDYNIDNALLVNPHEVLIVTGVTRARSSRNTYVPETPTHVHPVTPTHVPQQPLYLEPSRVNVLSTVNS